MDGDGGAGVRSVGRSGVTKEPTLATVGAGLAEEGQGGRAEGRGTGSGRRALGDEVWAAVDRLTSLVVRPQAPGRSSQVFQVPASQPRAPPGRRSDAHPREIANSRICPDSITSETSAEPIYLRSFVTCSLRFA